MFTTSKLNIKMMSSSPKSSAKGHRVRTFSIKLHELYLFVYNSVQIVGWTYLLLQTLVYFLNRGTLENFWKEIKWTVVVFQNAAILEILHAALGIVPSGVLVTLTQVYSRVFIVVGALLNTHGASVSPGLVLCVLAWSVTEIIRYSFYTLNIVKYMPKTLIFLRYSTFYLLYPLGVTGELLCMYHALGEVRNRTVWYILELLSIPVWIHWWFSQFFFLYICTQMLAYIPLFPYLFGHMLRQRKKIMPNLLKAD